MKTQKMVKISKSMISDAEFIAPLKDKSGEEIKQIIFKVWDQVQGGLYELIQALRTLELSGKFKELGFKTFDETLIKMIPIRLTTYHDFLRVARRFSKELIDKAGFPVLAQVMRKRLSASSEEVVRETIERKIESSGQLPPRKEISEIVERLSTPKEVKENKFLKSNYLEKEIKELRRENLELRRTIRDREEQIQKLKISLEDERRYREDLQKGKRSI